MAGLGFDPCLYIFKAATAVAMDKRQRQPANCSGIYIYYNCKMAGLGFDPCLYIFKVATAVAMDKQQRQPASCSGIYIYSSIFCLFARTV
jgi:hypothetical protein